MELRDRNLLDAAVQESYLAVPYAFAKLGANAQAAEYYETAMTSFEAESADIDGAIGAHRQRPHARHLLGGDKTRGAWLVLAAQDSCPRRRSRATSMPCWPTTISRKA